MAASFSARGRGTTCPPPAHVVQVTHTWRRRPLALPGGDVAARRGGSRSAGPGLRAGRPERGRGCGQVAGARRRRGIPGPLRSLSAPRRRPRPCWAAPSAGEVRCTGTVQLLNDGAGSPGPAGRGSPGPAGTCRRGQFCPAPGSSVRRTEGQGRWSCRSYRPQRVPRFGRRPQGPSVEAGSTVATCGPAVPGSSSCRGRPGLRAMKPFPLSSSRQRHRSFCTVMARRIKSC